MKAYIISYFGNRQEPEKRQIRKQNHQRQIEWWMNFDPELDFIITAADYDECDFIRHPKIQYIIENKLSIPGSRNILLETFYKSSDSWGIFMDNDGILKHHPKWPHTHFNINNHIRNNMNLYKDISLFMPHYDGVPGDGAFTKKYNNSDPKYSNVKWDKELCFDHMFVSLKGCLFYLQNLKQNIYMDTQMEPADDHDFALQHYLAGYQTYRIRNIMMYEYPSPSTWANNNSDRVNAIQTSYQKMSKKYNLPAQRSKWLRFVKQTYGHNHPKRLLLPYNT